ncbi:43kDa postsynaptic protein [Parasponia andersonii]|uniref:43kDa postsynaptic protein n=1 Tax=Parasponia andersonii TaxID=3476 RepID=A0A2P5BTV5_PARAD|nr:43kDa postsynaptic protein [Parasponia andersonii]
MSQLGVILQESLSREREARTILCFLREQMDVVDGARGRRRTLKQRLGLKGLGCCGATWGFRPTAISVRDSEENDDEDEERQAVEGAVENSPGPICSDPDPDHPGPPSMNLAAALAAERQFRLSNEATERSAASRDNGGNETAPGTLMRVSLMRLIEETDGGDGRREREMSGAVGSDSVCCVCMGRKKGAAFIPCGHTFCRVCSRELWLNRGACPLCNRPILEILDIF